MFIMYLLQKCFSPGASPAVKMSNTFRSFIYLLAQLIDSVILHVRHVRIHKHLGLPGGGGGVGGSEAYFLLFNYVNLRNLNIKEFQGGLIRGEVTRQE